MSGIQAAITVAVIALGTLAIRSAPFILFPKAQNTPPYIRYLGRVLPHAVMGMLVVYCFKSVRFDQFPYGLPEIVAGLCAVLLYLYKRSVILSIAASTILYIILLVII